MNTTEIIAIQILLSEQFAWSMWMENNTCIFIDLFTLGLDRPTIKLGSF